MKVTIRKAVVAAVGAAATAMAFALKDGNLTWSEVLVALGFTLGTFGATWKAAYEVVA